ncbi:uncharacterized protein LOC132337356 [Haemorhous mexicanus]|uniref:uncharacterized protein LOC132337356 n=1 Tax=Haemorhous mexicanus TaxID=30427 RepID=UPI0028BD390B|nr:uncharacterized protein LOC132337356 [Haemorhous mexicanus]
MFLKFPHATVEEVKNEKFWKAVGCLLTESTKKRDPAVKEGFMRLFLLIFEIVKNTAANHELESKKCPSSPVLSKPSYLPSFPTPASAPTLGKSEGATHPQQTQGCYPLPGSPRFPWYPHHGSDGHTVGESVPKPLSNPFIPIDNSVNVQGRFVSQNPFLAHSREVPQDGCCLVAAIPMSQNGHCHVATVPAPKNGCHLVANSSSSQNSFLLLLPPPPPPPPPDPAFPSSSSPAISALLSPPKCDGATAPPMSPDPSPPPGSTIGPAPCPTLPPPRVPPLTLRVPPSWFLFPMPHPLVPTVMQQLGGSGRTGRGGDSEAGSIK